ncbi:hypothetical protein MTR_2g438080 [Medicago truncatula]|uniref:Uncharacterized protein n=1 Tax=Medicago truncatula TaxID=3880 RepID=A0A072V6D9_MEDTR|nr:hypothetical protein MTR_2g438080 [Medicago truncatula]
MFKLRNIAILRKFDIGLKVHTSRHHCDDFSAQRNASNSSPCKELNSKNSTLMFKPDATHNKARKMNNKHASLQAMAEQSSSTTNTNMTNHEDNPTPMMNNNSPRRFTRSTNP